MSSIIFGAIFVIGTTISCATSSGGQTSTNLEKNSAMNSELGQRPSQKSPIGEKAKDCVRSINQFGQPVNCYCDSGFVYNPITGRCAKGGRMCTQSLVEMFNEKNAHCYTARNGCEAGDLKSIGWRQRKPDDSCQK